MTVLIPAFEPDERLIRLVTELKSKSDYNIVIVNDGSDETFDYIFETVKNIGCTVLIHKINRGKGMALKTGFAYILDNGDKNSGVVTADADGQHLVDDIIRVANFIPASQKNIVLGVRKFIGNVPLRSTIGNAITRAVFSLVSGEKISDTQTGLRGLPFSILPWLISLEGERFEYEMNMLLKAKAAGIKFTQVDIETVYIAGNMSSHFRTIRDSVRVYLPFFKFCFTGITSAVVDYVLLFVFQWLTGNLLIAVVVARVASSAVNYTINRYLVFVSAKKERKTLTELIYYYILVCILLALNYLLLSYLSQNLKINLFLSKVLTELTLFFISYVVQHFIIFRKITRSKILN